MTNLLSRKDIAVLTGMTADKVRANEERLGLKPIRINARNIKYANHCVVRVKEGRIAYLNRVISGSKTQFDIALEQSASPPAEPSDAERIATVLIDGGLDGVPSEVIFQLEALIVSLSFRRAGEALAHILNALPPNG